MRNPRHFQGEETMAKNGKNKKAKSGGGTYVVTEIIGTSPRSFADAAQNAVKTAARSLKDLRVAEVTKLDAKIENGKISTYRARLQVSFKYHEGMDDDD
jgi:flavin-binding protein dodecin